jgi:hypothetical protein
MAVVPFPASRIVRDRLGDGDLATLFGRWPKGDVIDVETAVSAEFNCFLATGEAGDHHFVFWREPSGQYVREDTRTGRKVTGATLAEVMPESPPQG